MFVRCGTGRQRQHIGKHGLHSRCGFDSHGYSTYGAGWVRLIWSPRTNVDLYGSTAAITLYSRLGVTIGLGSDWTASGSVNMMRELACADELNKAHFDNFYTDRELFDMATIGTTRAFQIESCRQLRGRKVADIAIFHNVVHKDFRAVIDGNPSDVCLSPAGVRSFMATHLARPTWWKHWL